MTPFLIGLAASLSTLLGGWLAIKFQDRLHLILGFTAGAVMAVALLDLLKEAVELQPAPGGALPAMAAALIGSLAYLCLDRVLRSADTRSDGTRGHLGAASLTFHSFLDGLAIGLAFRVSPQVGTPVAVAVLAHDFSDGINTVNLSLAGGVRQQGAWRWLIADAAAPLAGVAAAALIAIPPGRLSLVLALFSGFFLYIGWSELTPESYQRHPRIWTTLSTIAGAAAMYAVIRIAG